MTNTPTGTYKPGMLAPASGFVRVPGFDEEKTVIKGKPLPPTRTAGQHYIYSAVPRHAASRRAV